MSIISQALDKRRHPPASGAGLPKATGISTGTSGRISAAPGPGRAPSAATSLMILAQGGMAPSIAPPSRAAWPPAVVRRESRPESRKSLLRLAAACLAMIAIGTGFFLGEAFSRSNKQESDGGGATALSELKVAPALAPALAPPVADLAVADLAEADLAEADLAGANHEALAAEDASAQPAALEPTPVVVRFEVSLRPDPVAASTTLRSVPVSVPASGSAAQPMTLPAALPPPPAPVVASLSDLPLPPDPPELETVEFEAEDERDLAAGHVPESSTRGRSSSAAKAPAYKVGGILWSETEPMAVLNDEIVSEGFRIDDVLVKKINRTSVTLERNGVEFEVR